MFGVEFWIIRKQTSWVFIFRDFKVCNSTFSSKLWQHKRSSGFFVVLVFSISWYHKSDLNFQNQKHCVRLFTSILDLADAQGAKLWEHGLHLTRGAGMASKSDPKPDLLIVCSGSLTLTSPFQGKQASTSEVASEHVCLQCGQPLI